MFEPNSRYITRGIQETLPVDIQLLLWLAIDSLRITAKAPLDYLQVFTFEKEGDLLVIRHEQEKPRRVQVHNTPFREAYRAILGEKVYVIDDGDHSTMLYARDY